MNDIQKEHVLHKVLASSAFICALCILPVAQYFLVNNQLPQGRGDQGQVAGVTTERASVAPETTVADETPECSTNTTQELADLQLYLDGKKAALLRDYQQLVAPYEQALLAVTGAPAKAEEERAAIQSLIDREQQPYLKKLTAVEEAVESQKKDIESRSCAAE